MSLPKGNTNLFHYSVNRQGQNKNWDKELLTTGFEDTTGTLKDLEQEISNGHAISGAHFNGQRRKTVNVTKVGLLLVDVDEGMTIEQAKTDPFVQKYCALAYTTVSHSLDHHKFRLIFPLPQAMERSDFEQLVGEVLKQFSHDPSCKDAGRVFYGNTKAEFFIKNPNTVLPQDGIEAAIAKGKIEREEAERKRQEKIEWLKNNPPYTCSDAIPLINCCRKDVREMVIAGVPPKSGHNDAALSIVMELIGVERYLEQIGQKFSGSARDYYDQFVASSGVDDNKVEGRWEWGESRINIDTSIPPETIQRCIYAHEFKQLKTEKERNQYRKDHPNFEPINGTTNQLVGNSKVIPFTKKQPQPIIQESLKSIALSHLSRKNLEVAIANVAKDYDQPIQSVRRIYEETVREIESQESREDVKQELSQLLISQTDSIKLETILPTGLAEPINKFMGWLNLRPESAATALITGISSVLPSQTKIVINKNLGWSESAGFNGGIVASSTQKKSPIMNTFMIRPLAKLQVEENENYQQKLDDYKAQIAEYEDLAKTKKDKDLLTEKYPDGPPEPPKKNVWFYTNATLEKIKTQMAEQPGKGILLAVDELAGLTGNMNAYRGGRGSDRQDLMSMKDGSPVSVGRKNGDVFVESPLLSIFGTIQPKVLQKILGDGNDSDGFFARICLVRQPTVATILPELTDQSFDISPMIEALYRQASSLKATTYQLSPEGYSALKRATDAYELKRVAVGEHPIGNVYGKNGGRIGELSMLLHVIKHCFECKIPPEQIELETVTAAIALTEFFTNQQSAIYAELDNQPASIAPHLAKIINLAKSKGELTPRIVARYIRDMSKSKDQIPTYFQELQDMGLGTIQHGRTLKFTLTIDPPTSGEVSTSVNKVSTSVDTLKPIQDKDLDKVSTSVNTKINFSDTKPSNPKSSSSKNHVDTCDSVDTLDLNLDTVSDSPVDTSLTDVDTLLTDVDTSQDPPTKDWTELVGENDLQIQRLGLSLQDAQGYLKNRYGVKSRQLLTDAELFDWINYCSQLLSPISNFVG